MAGPGRWRYVLPGPERGGGNTTHLPRRGISFTADLHLQWVSTTRVQI